MTYVAASAISGMSVQVLSQGGIPNADKVRMLTYGTYTAADFYLTANDGVVFQPAVVRVFNTTDGTGSEWFLEDTRTAAQITAGSTDLLANLVNAGYTQAATGDKTPVAKASAGVSWNGGRLQFDVTACAPITDDDEIIIEISRG